MTGQHGRTKALSEVSPFGFEVTEKETYYRIFIFHQQIGDDTITV
jgi:hypothetical protein